MYLWVTCLVFLLCSANGQYPDPDDVPDFSWDDVTPLDEYVHDDDGEFKWEVVDVYNYSNVDVFIINMTSQRWLDETRVTRSLWFHQMGLAIPHEVTNYSTAMLVIDGGSNRDPEDYPGPESYFNFGSALFANATGCIAGYMRQVPNQPVVFADDPLGRSRSEDAIIAYTWKWVIDRLLAGENPDEVDKDIILRMPMTKAAKRGLDTIVEFASEYGGPEFNIDKFAVSGASKRGWTTWSLAAVDRRVIGIMPLVMSLLWFEETLMKHFRGFDGGWSFAFKPYHDENLTHYLTDPIAHPVFNIEDPFRYRSRLLGIPKLMSVTTGDEFFLLQDSHNWWQHMGGIKHIMMNPNAEHAMFPHWLRIFKTVVSYFMILITDGPAGLPNVTWDREYFEDSGKITFRTSPPPDAIRGLRAETLANETIRDFRLVSGYPDQALHPVWWADKNVTEEDDGVFTMEEEHLEEGSRWVGFFIEGEWDTTDYFSEQRDVFMLLTSEVCIIPDEYPAEPCSGSDCYGYLM